MALAPGHRLGQIIGDTLELAVEPPLRKFAEKHGLYLDRKGERPARSGKKLTWKDSLGNTHDLDYVLERGGSDDSIGIPVAFIETAWRRYTKHSRNKAQEIQGAVLPLLATYSHAKPFAGVILAGVFTQGSLDQLESNEFEVLYIPYETITSVFAEIGMDVAYDEDTPDDKLREQIDAYDDLSENDRWELGELLRHEIEEDLDTFIDQLGKTVLRQIASVSVLPLHGETRSFETVEDAVGLLRDYQPPDAPGPLDRFEVIIRYDNDDRVVADFGNAADAIAFLESFDG